MVAVGVLAAATEYACGLLVLAAFFPWRIRGKLRSAAAPFICGLVHILFSVLTTAWPLLPRVILPAPFLKTTPLFEMIEQA